jgi:hypothetical protein
MKFCSLIFSKPLLLAMFVFGTFALSAQVSSLSPYSRFAIGTLVQEGTSTQMGMGGVSSALANFSSINYQNPASYAFMLKSGMHVGARGEFLTLSNTTQSEKLSLSTLNHIGLNFKRQGGKTGFALGLAPFSTSGYSITDTQQIENIGNVDYSYDGEGGVNRAYFGFGRIIVLSTDKGLLDKSLAPDSTASSNLISIGANLNYYFGSLKQTRRVVFDDASYLHTRITAKTAVSDVDFNFGVLGQFNLKNTYSSAGERIKKTDLYVGLTYSIGNDLNAKFNELTESITYVSAFELVVDTISQFDASNASIAIPQKITAGIGLRHETRKGRTLEFQLDYKTQDWSQFSGDDSPVIETAVLAKAQSFHLGFEFTPLSPSKDPNFIQSINYRLGVRYADTYLKINNQQISERAISAGLTIPLRRSQSASRIIFGTEFGQRGTTDASLIHEQFVNVYVGLSLSPHVFNNWFVKRQYD